LALCVNEEGHPYVVERDPGEKMKSMLPVPRKNSVHAEIMDIFPFRCELALHHENLVETNFEAVFSDNQAVQESIRSGS
jgi:hypothetical protein